MSSRSLTGYDNRDLASDAADEEVYLYDDASGALGCPSCNPTGARPVGVLDQHVAKEGLGLLVDRPRRLGLRRHERLAVRQHSRLDRRG